VLDEPTTGLGVVTQDLVLAEIDHQRKRVGFALLIVSHDLAVVARLCDSVLVMQDGACVDRGASPSCSRARRIRTRPRWSRPARTCGSCAGMGLPSSASELLGRRRCCRCASFHGQRGESAWSPRKR